MAHSTCSDTCSASPTCTGVSPAPTTPEPDPRLCSQAAQLPHARATLNFQGHWQGTACPYICPVGPTRTSEYATVLLTCGCAARLNELRLQSGQSPRHLFSCCRKPALAEWQTLQGTWHRAPRIKVLRWSGMVRTVAPDWRYSFSLNYAVFFPPKIKILIYRHV